MSLPNKLRIVYDASAKRNNSTVSLNDCLETGLPLQNSLYDILVRFRMTPILLCGDIQKAFWQIRIREFQRFTWIKNLDPNIVEINRSCRLLFGLTQSPFILEGTIKQHFENYENEHPMVIENIQDDMYVDDLVSGGTEINTVKNIKQGSIELFSKELFFFNLHKWHSNIPSLENNNVNSEQTYAKELCNNDSGHTKILGLGWNKKTDKVYIEIPQFSEKQITKRKILSYIASIYDPLGLISASHIIWKLIWPQT